MPSSELPLVEQMRIDWDARAHDNARHFIATGVRDWSDEAFFADGRRDIESYILPYRDWICGGREFSDLRMLEIGCGAARMTVGLSDLFAFVDAVDISPVMASLARETVSDRTNVRVHVGNGTDLAMLPDAVFDFVFSFIVFQHIPRKSIVEDYINETHRVLRPGGVFRFQVQGYPIPEEKADTWVGVGFSEEEMLAFADRTGFEVLSTTGAGTQYFWLTFRKRRR